MAEPTDVQRRLVAVFAADVEGYSRLMGADEVGTLKGLTECRAILDKAIADHRGRIANTAGDSVLAEFGSAVDAVQCAVEAQAALAEANASVTPEKRINFRIGIHVGDVMVRAGDLFGDGVNIAARLQMLAQAGGVCISGVTRDQVRKVLSLTFVDLGAQQVKNIDEPVQVFRVADIDKADAVARATGPAGLPSSLLDKPSIAVLPFQNMSGDPDQEYFADGIVEDMTTALSRFDSIYVIARNSSFTYKGKTIDIKQVGRELGVRYVLEGSVRKAGNRVRITGQLIEAATNTHLWADRFEGALDDIFTLQDKVTSSVVGIVEPKILLSEVQRARVKSTTNLTAYDYYLRGVPTYNKWTREANQEAYVLFSAALELDPNYAAAMIRLAWVHAQRWMQNWTDNREREVVAGRALQQRALELAKDDQFVLAGSAYLHIQFGGDAATSISLIDRAMRLNPNSAGTLESSTWVHIRSGDPEIAVEHCLRAIQLNPLTQTKTPLAVAYFLLGRREEALACVAEALINAPRALPTLRFAATIMAGLGQLEEAHQLVKRILEINPAARMIPGPWIPEKAEYKRKYTDAMRTLVQLGFPE